MTEREKFEKWFAETGLQEYQCSNSEMASLRNFSWLAWQAATEAAAPQGYKVVPINPTEEMITAWYESPYSEDGTENMLSGYEAMLTAAPEVK